MEFIREHTLLNKLIVVDGIGKCGKSLLLDIITCFSGVEKQEYNEFLEYIALAYKYEKISIDMAVAILKTQMDTELYNNMIGRYTNTRISDATSVYKYHTPERYIARSVSEDGAIVHSRVQSEKPVYLCWSHDLINKSDIIFETFNDKLEFIYLNRRPVDIIYEWGTVGYSQRMANDPTEMQYCIKYGNDSVPEAAFGWEEEFLRITPHERTVKLIHTYFKLNQEALFKKREYKNIHVINFEELLTNPYHEIEKLKNIIGNATLAHLDLMLAKARCPRVLNDNDLLKREKEIRQTISNEYAALLPEINEMYENIKSLSVTHKRVSGY